MQVGLRSVGLWKVRGVTVIKKSLGKFRKILLWNFNDKSLKMSAFLRKNKKKLKKQEAKASPKPIRLVYYAPDVTAHLGEKKKGESRKTHEDQLRGLGPKKEWGEQKKMRLNLR